MQRELDACYAEIERLRRMLDESTMPSTQRRASTSGPSRTRRPTQSLQNQVVSPRASTRRPTQVVHILSSPSPKPTKNASSTQKSGFVEKTRQRAVEAEYFKLMRLAQLEADCELTENLPIRARRRARAQQQRKTQEVHFKFEPGEGSAHEQGECIAPEMGSEDHVEASIYVSAEAASVDQHESARGPLSKPSEHVPPAVPSNDQSAVSASETPALTRNADPAMDSSQCDASARKLQAFWRHRGGQRPQKMIDAIQPNPASESDMEAALALVAQYEEDAALSDDSDADAEADAGADAEHTPTSDEYEAASASTEDNYNVEPDSSPRVLQDRMEPTPAENVTVPSEPPPGDLVDTDDDDDATVEVDVASNALDEQRAIIGVQEVTTDISSDTSAGDSARSAPEPAVFVDDAIVDEQDDSDHGGRAAAQDEQMVADDDERDPAVDYANEIEENAAVDLDNPSAIVPSNQSTINEATSEAAGEADERGEHAGVDPGNSGVMPLSDQPVGNEANGEDAGETAADAIEPDDEDSSQRSTANEPTAVDMTVEHHRSDAFDGEAGEIEENAAVDSSISSAIAASDQSVINIADCEDAGEEAKGAIEADEEDASRISTTNQLTTVGIAEEHHRSDSIDRDSDRGADAINASTEAEDKTPHLAEEVADDSKGDERDHDLEDMVSGAPPRHEQDERDCDVIDHRALDDEARPADVDASASVDAETVGSRSPPGEASSENKQPDEEDVASGKADEIPLTVSRHDVAITVQSPTTDVPDEMDLTASEPAAYSNEISEECTAQRDVVVASAEHDRDDDEQRSDSITHTENSVASVDPVATGTEAIDPCDRMSRDSSKAAFVEDAVSARTMPGQSRTDEPRFDLDSAIRDCPPDPASTGSPSPHIGTTADAQTSDVREDLEAEFGPDSDLPGATDRASKIEDPICDQVLDGTNAPTINVEVPVVDDDALLRGAAKSTAAIKCDDLVEDERAVIAPGDSTQQSQADENDTSCAEQLVNPLSSEGGPLLHSNSSADEPQEVPTNMDGTSRDPAEVLVNAVNRQDLAPESNTTEVGLEHAGADDEHIEQQLTAGDSAVESEAVSSPDPDMQDEPANEIEN